MKSARDGEKPAMNPNNYASLAASKRLVEAGIVLETEALWVKWYFDTSTNMNYSPFEWRLMYRSLTQVDLEYIPAPSMAEVWRELPETIDEYDLTCEKIFNGGMQAGYTTYDVSGLRWKVLLNAANPTDALIDLLIWVRKEANHE
jgi:hypothetical protein